MLFNPKYGSVGLFAFPYFVLFELLGPFIETFGYLAVIVSYLLGILDVQFFMMFLAVAILYGMFLSIAAILLEEISFRRYPGWIDLTKLLAYSVLENFGYRQILSAMKVKAFWDAIRRCRAAVSARTPFRSRPPADSLLTSWAWQTGSAPKSPRKRSRPKPARPGCSGSPFWTRRARR
jgi:hypothetical protein